MDFNAASDILSKATRNESRDNSFGDVEISWIDDKGNEVAFGYFSGSVAEVGIHEDRTKFENDKARHLRKLGHEGIISRNDETGPDDFVLGRIQSGLSLEDVRREFC
jgi:hypothetical protein